MAKTKVLCPFSKELCKECPQYRGRHYYLCFAKKYRGYLGDTEDMVTQDKRHLGAKETIEVTDSYRLPIPPPLKLNPTWLVFSDFPERTNK
jgi:hypothetical protein